MPSNESQNEKVDTVGLFLRAMVDREPGKRKVKASKAALIDLAQLDMGDSSDDSDFKVDEAKLDEDDDISINSDPDNNDDGDDDDDNEGSNESESSDGEHSSTNNSTNMSVGELLRRAEQKQKADLVKAMGAGQPKILVCSVCLGDNSDDTNEIVTCDGWCHVSVHEGCYGVSDTVSVSSTVSSSSTEPWFCDACKAGVRNPSCELCPNLGYGIYKETEMGRWIHLVCALYVPGVSFSEVDKLSFPTLFEMAYSRYGSKVCSLCEDARYAKTGVCIGCDAGMCRSYFHVTCAQKEGLLSEVNHGEADQADPYYAHCKLHTDRELIKRRKRNWLTLQLHTKQSDQSNMSTKEQSRLERKLSKYREKYNQLKTSRPTPWFPTQKMPRSLSTCASVFRTLLHKTEQMGIKTETPEAELASIGDIRRRWHIPPAFNIEYISYYVDRTQRLKDMKNKLEMLLKENTELSQEEEKLTAHLDDVKKRNKEIADKNASLLSKSLEIHDLLKGIAGRPLPLPPVVAALHNPPSVSAISQSLQKGSGTAGRETRRIVTKAATKIFSDPLVDKGIPISHASRGDNQAPLRIPSSSQPASTDTSSAASHSAIENSSPLKHPLGKKKPIVAPSTPATKDGSATIVSTTFSSPAAPKSVPTKSSVGEGVTGSPSDVHTCSVCKQSTDQHLIILCDTCVLYYHLCCLDPPLTRMPKKTKQMGWQCSDCCKSSDSEKVAEVDTSAPRKLRRVIREPDKFSPLQSTSPNSKTVHDRNTSLTPPSASSVGSPPTPSTPTKPSTGSPVGRPCGKRKLIGKKMSRQPKKFKKLATDTDDSKTESGIKTNQNLSSPSQKSRKMDATDSKNYSISDGCKNEALKRIASPVRGVMDRQQKGLIKTSSSAVASSGRGRTRRSCKVGPKPGRPKNDDNFQMNSADLNESTKGQNMLPQVVLTDKDLPAVSDPVATTSVSLTPTSRMDSPAVASIPTSASDNKISDGVSAQVTITSIAEPTSGVAKTPDAPPKPSVSLIPTAVSSAASVTSIPTSVCTSVTPACNINMSSVPATVSSSISSTESLPVSSSVVSSIAASNLISSTPHATLKAAPIITSSTDTKVSDGTSRLTSTQSLTIGSTIASSSVVTAQSSSTLPRSDSQTCPDTSLISSLSSVTTFTSSSSSVGLPMNPPSHAASLTDTFTEGFSVQIIEDDSSTPLSPRKEKKHRDGSKKKKKDKDKDKNGEKRRKKHHHHHHWDLPSQSSELLAPLRLKIKPLPPRDPLLSSPPLSYSSHVSFTPVSELQSPATSPQKLSSLPLHVGPEYSQASSDLKRNVPKDITLPTTSHLSSAPITHSTISSSFSQETPPPGYPPLPAGYTLTQPLLEDTEALISDKANSTSSTHSTASATKEQRNSSASESSVDHRRSSADSILSSTATSSSAGGGGSSQQFSICDVCKETGGVTNTVECDECHKAYHFNCLDPPLKKTPKRRGYFWYCEDCEPSK